MFVTKPMKLRYLIISLTSLFFTFVLVPSHAIDNEGNEQILAIDSCEFMGRILYLAVEKFKTDRGLDDVKILLEPVFLNGVREIEDASERQAIEKRYQQALIEAFLVNTKSPKSYALEFMRNCRKNQKDNR